MSDISDTSGTLTPTNDAVGLSDPSLGQSGRQMLDLVNRLHNTGVNVDIDLPLIAVIGQQSAGKSSLIESISGITLPRAAGTCTRCPTECRLARSSDAWTCKVSIRIAAKNGGKSSTIQLGDIITSKSNVEDRIRRAQWAILNPSALNAHGAEYFLTGDKHGENAELTFSNNFVSLEISGPDVADLSFCDLPGLIAGVGQGGNVGDIDLVKSLVSSYIKRPSCIILLTVACETDFQNQGAQELAKAHDPEGKRTIGVLTKPDRIPQGEEPAWISLIRNEREPLENGWYCVKQPSSAEITQGITWSEARKKEVDYFETKGVWQDLEGVYKRYLGTGNLVERLSGILSGLISKRLPEIQREIHSTIIKTQEALSKLPAAPSSDPRSEIGSLLHKFVWDLSIHIQGHPEDGIIQAIRPAQETFRRAIRMTSPEFQPFYRDQNKTTGLMKFLIGEEGEEHSLHSADDDDTSSDDDSKFKSIFDVDTRDGESLGMIQKRSRNQKKKVAIYIDEVMARAEGARTRELPGNYPYAVQETYIKSFVKQWHNPAKILCQTVGYMLEDYVHNLVHEHFKSFGQGLLEQRVEILIQTHLKECIKRTEARVEWLFALENGPFTLNNHYLVDYREKFLSHYRSAREMDRNANLTEAIKSYNTTAASQTKSDGRNSSLTTTGIAKVLAGLAEIGVYGVKPEDIGNIVAKDGTESALVIMANVRAYFQVAYKRFSDNIPLAIDHELVRGVERDILHALNTGLGINDPDGLRTCAELAHEDPKVSARREELLKKLDRMSAAGHELHQIGRKA